MKRIAVIGSPGAGKSTLSRWLGEKLNVPVFHLDRLFWNPGWKKTPPEEFVRVQKQIMRQHTECIMDGDYASTLKVRLRECDTVIFLDFPRTLCLFRVIMRTVKSLCGGPRPSMAEGCPAKMDRDYIEFLQYIWRFSKQQRPKITEILEPFDGRIYWLKSSREVEQFQKRFVSN